MYEETGPSGEHLEPEPQAERGAPGSRDTGSDQPAGGPVDRPVGEAEPGDSTSIDPRTPPMTRPICNAEVVEHEHDT